MRRAHLVGAGIGGALAGLAAYALAIEPLRLEITRPRLALPRLPAAWDGLKVLLLADPHVQDWGAKEEGLLHRLAPIEAPDLIVWGGDFLGRRDATAVALQLVEAVADLFPDAPAFAVLGNAEHKIWREQRCRFVQDLGALRVRVLLNEWTEFTYRGASVTIAGTDDPYYGKADWEQTLCGAPAGRFTLLLAHSPQLALLAARAGVDLMLSGHTHGGQVRLPLLGALRTQNPLARTLDAGAFDRARLARVLGRDPGGDLVTYITRGIGLANLPGVSWFAPRFNCRPEATLLTLTRTV